MDPGTGDLEEARECQLCELVGDAADDSDEDDEAGCGQNETDEDCAQALSSLALATQPSHLSSTVTSTGSTTLLSPSARFRLRHRLRISTSLFVFPCRPPQILLAPRRQMFAQGTVQQPVLIPARGADPLFPDGPPSEVLDVVERFCAAAGRQQRLPNIDIDGVRQQVCSAGAARRMLLSVMQGQNHVRHCWAAMMTANMVHPSWWPTTEHVPTYDQVIVSRGPAGIGCHRDVYGEQKQLVHTYLTIIYGRKRVVMAPPEAASWLLQPPYSERAFPDGSHCADDGELWQRVVEAGGYCFELAPQDDGDAVTLFVPAGWLHWLQPVSDWSIVYGGSRFA